MNCKFTVNVTTLTLLFAIGVVTPGCANTHSTPLTIPSCHYSSASGRLTLTAVASNESAKTVKQLDIAIAQFDKNGKLLPGTIHLQPQITIPAHETGEITISSVSKNAISPDAIALQCRAAWITYADGSKWFSPARALYP